MANIVGDAGNNVLTGTGAADLIAGGGGSHDELYGLAGNDNLTAGAGNDKLDGGTGADVMFGGIGNDTYYVDNAGDKVLESAGGGTADTVYAAVSIAALADNVEWGILTGKANLNITGNGEDNTLVGNDGNNVIDGGIGADQMWGSKGNDTFIVNIAGDTVVEFANEGIDLVKSAVTYSLLTYGAVENLSLTGTGDNDATGNLLNNVLTGNDGKNRLDGGAGDDVMAGGKGDDTYYVDSVKDKVVETVAGFAGGYDTVNSSVDFSLAKLGNVEALFLQGAVGLKATGNALGNTIYGTDGDDFIDGGAANDFMAGGKGNDTYYYSQANDYAKELANEGNDTIISKVQIDFDLNVENYTFITAAKITFAGDAGDNIIKGGSGADTIAGGGGNHDELYGNAGNDVLTAGSGNDVLDGGKGIDVMTGGAGNDTYYIDNAKDQVIEGSGGGTLDAISASISITKLADNVEWGVLTGKSNLNITGNDDDNFLIGNDGNNILDGGIGSDLMAGGKGNDIYLVHSASDGVLESDGEGVDLVKSSITYTLGNYVENLSLTGTANIDGTGNGAGNVLVGNDGDNTLDGKGGADVMNGGKGNDLYIVDDAGDKIIESVAGVAGGYDRVSSSVDFSLAKLGNVEALYLQGSADLYATGNMLSNYIVGNDGNNFIDGGIGQDKMFGGKGSDTYHVDSLGDQVTEFSNEGNDTIISKVAFSQAVANVENYTFNTTAAVHFIGAGNTNTVNGGSGADILDSSASAVASLHGNAGNDTLIGGAGADYISGDAGADTMKGGGGGDLYVVDNVGDKIVELFNDGTDSVISFVSVAALWANVEHLTLSGFANLNATGNDLDNQIAGNGGNNKLDGGVGDDTLLGGAGNDTLTGGAGKDTLVFNALAGAGHDTITDFAKGQDELQFQNVADKNNDNAITLADLFLEVTGIADLGVGKNVEVTFESGNHLTFIGAGTGSVNSLDDLVANAATQIHVS